MKHFATIILLLLVASAIRAAKIDTILVKSPAMGKDVKVVYVVPQQAMGKKATPCPVIYLLHGYSGNEQDWISHKTDLGSIADEKGIFFACPDGRNSWYWDSPRNPDYRYETFISSELVAYTDSHFATQPRRESRAITGLSMGGHGALWNAFRHPDVFGAVGSMSGGVDIRPFPQNWEIKEQIGEMASNKDVWDTHTAINQIGKLKNGELAITIDCGESDFFLEVNKELHQRLLGQGIDHDFTTRPGGHTWPYWTNSLDFHILFFTKYFHSHAIN